MGHWLQTGCFAKGGFRSTLQSGTYKLPNSVRLVSPIYAQSPHLSFPHHQHPQAPHPHPPLSHSL